MRREIIFLVEKIPQSSSEGFNPNDPTLLCGWKQALKVQVTRMTNHTFLQDPGAPDFQTMLSPSDGPTKEQYLAHATREHLLEVGNACFDAFYKMCLDIAKGKTKEEAVKHIEEMTKAMRKSLCMDGEKEEVEPEEDEELVIIEGDGGEGMA